MSIELWVVDRIPIGYGEGGGKNAFRFQEQNEEQRPDAEICGEESRPFPAGVESLPSR